MEGETPESKVCSRKNRLNLKQVVKKNSVRNVEEALKELPTKKLTKLRKNENLGTWLKKYDLFFIRFCLDGPNY